MKKLLIASIVAANCAGVAFAETNVALHGAVAASGSGFGDWSAKWGTGDYAAADTVTDGLFLPIGRQWNIGTVFWNGPAGGDSSDLVTISLPAVSVVTSITLQADNNDDYGISYRDTSGTWTYLGAISPHRSWGMDMGYMTLGAPITATAFAIQSVGGDGYYSVSEFQAMGVPVPEPETYAMMLAGLGLLGAAARRRRA